VLFSGLEQLEYLKCSFQALSALLHNQVMIFDLPGDTVRRYNPEFGV